MATYRSNPNRRLVRAGRLLAGGGSFSDAGRSFSDVEHECEHGRLAGDPTPPCGCWPQEAHARCRPVAERRWT